MSTRPVTLSLRSAGGEVIGEYAARLVVGRDCTRDAGAWAITHGLGRPQGGTHTEVAFVDGTLGARDTLGDGSWHDPERERLADDLVRQVAHEVYGERWAFHYRPEQVEGDVLRHGSTLRERIEVSAVEVWS